MPNSSVLSHFSHVQLFVTPWTIACQVPLSMGILQARILEWATISFSSQTSLFKTKLFLYTLYK